MPGTSGEPTTEVRSSQTPGTSGEPTTEVRSSQTPGTSGQLNPRILRTRQQNAMNEQENVPSITDDADDASSATADTDEENYSEVTQILREANPN